MTRTVVLPVPSDAEERLALYLLAAAVAPPEREYRFAAHLGRRWRFDFAWPRRCLALEVEGGLYGRGGRGSNRPCPTCGQVPAGAHRSVAGVKRDLEKYTIAAVLGWRVLRVTPEQVI